MIETYTQALNGMYYWLPGGVIAPACFLLLGFSWGMSRYIRSFKYIYYFYIEHGIVIWNTDGRDRTAAMNKIAKKYKLLDSDYFEPHGYVTGLGIVGLCSLLGLLIGSLWPLSLVIGILTIPNFVLRRVAREKRNKAIFEQELKGEN